VSSEEKRHTVYPAQDQHSYNRPQNLTDEQFIEYVRSMPKELFEKKVFGKHGREFSEQISEASRRINEAAAKEEIKNEHADRS